MSLRHLIVLTLIAAVAGLAAERVLRRPLPYSFLGPILAAFLGAWLAADVLHLSIAPDLSLESIPLVPAALGAIIVLLAYSRLSHTAKLRLKRR